MSFRPLADECRLQVRNADSRPENQRFSTNAFVRPIILRAVTSGTPSELWGRVVNARRWGVMAFAVMAANMFGCTLVRRPAASPPPPPPPVVIAVAPVLNLSNRSDWDPAKVTDWLASEMQGFPGVVVIPVNRTVATLAAQGRNAVRTGDEALALAEALEADVTVVAAVTEFNPYDPPTVGLVLQWYERANVSQAVRVDPAAASRAATLAAAATPVERGGAENAPRYQFQRVFNAADHEILKDVESFADERPGHRSPLGWRAYLRSQELFVRYCFHSAFRTMHSARVGSLQAPATSEARS